MHLSEAKNSLGVAAFNDRVLFSGGYNLNGISSTVDMFSLGDAPEQYATVTYRWPTAIVSYGFGD